MRKLGEKTKCTEKQDVTSDMEKNPYAELKRIILAKGSKVN